MKFNDLQLGGTNTWEYTRKNQAQFSTGISKSREGILAAAFFLFDTFINPIAHFFTGFKVGNIFAF